ncbi:pyridoxal phosphate-dependent decarboxylase family protein [Planctomicrobium sp. SH661]|uniref:pyridoxal phosphate-dependent decarboxylase family protein n=1 Tax=Planctomicrobium sp. SH661 TaxID=3448124 RepID=UPI003F5C3440
MLLTPDHLELLQQCRDLLASGFKHLPPVSEQPVSPEMTSVLERTAMRLQDNFPYPHPFYLGQMLRPPHPVACLAYTLAMTINPNNHAHDGGRATSAMELEVISRMAAMCGWTSHLGHLCSGGTVANFEALWVARELTGGQGVVASSQAHYTHERLSRVLQVPFHAVRVDAAGRMDLQHLEELLKCGDIGTVVATLGTTGLGAVDPLDELLELRNRYAFRLHVDAAYGGYFRLASNLSESTARAFEAMSQADSIVIDPHKHGLQPYGCGCVLFRDRSVAAIYHHESPYTYFTSDDLHLGEISLECSRAGAAAAALWATMELFPLTATGEFARDLHRCRDAALLLHEWIASQPVFVPVVSPELDLVVWVVKAETSSQSSLLAREFFDAAQASNVHLALLTLPRTFLEHLNAVAHWDSDTVTCLRACTMKPEHLEWMPRILEQLQATVSKVFATAKA